MTIFRHFGAWEGIFLPPGKCVAYDFRNAHFFRRFGTWKVSSRKRFGRVSDREVNIFRSFEEWESVFSPSRKQSHYLLRNDHFFRCFGTWKIFLPNYIRNGFLLPKWPFFRRFGAWKFPPEISKVRVALLEQHFLTMWSLRMRILSSGETAGLSFAKWPFFGRFGTWNFPPEILNGRVPVRELTIFGSCGTREIVFLLPTKQTAYRSRIKLLYDVSAHEKFPPEIQNCQVPVREVTIFGLSEPRKAHSLVRGNCQLTVKKWIFFLSLQHLKNIYCRMTKWPVSG